MQKTEFEISKMDCPSEENLIRLKLQDVSGIEHLEFDIDNRKLYVFHISELQGIENAIAQLKLGSKVIGSVESDEKFESENSQQKKILWLVLGINFLFFLIEINTGFISDSMALVADSLDMLADSFVYALSIMAIGTSLVLKKKVAKLAGYFQIILAAAGFFEILRRFLNLEEKPNFQIMILVSILALIANALCLYILKKGKNKSEPHMKASIIFTSNDVIINLGVILAGILVLYFNSKIPDLLIGALVFGLVIQGAIRILKLSK